MTKQQIIGSVRQLPRKEQVHLIQELWQIVDPDDSELSLSPVFTAELDRRFAEFEQNPDATTPWSEVKNDVLRQRFFTT